MNKKKLKKALKVAIRKNQEVIVIYTNDIAFDDLFESMKKGNEIYEKAINTAKLEQRKYVVYSRTREDDTIIAFICVPVERLKNSQEYFDKILELCNKHLISGPLVLHPFNEVIGK